jgi:hypothetical protein
VRRAVALMTKPANWDWWTARAQQWERNGWTEGAQYWRRARWQEWDQENKPARKCPARQWEGPS